MILTKICPICNKEFTCETTRINGSKSCDCESMACKCLECWLVSIKYKPFNHNIIKQRIRTAHLCFDTTIKNIDVKIKYVLEKLIYELVLIDL